MHLADRKVIAGTALLRSTHYRSPPYTLSQETLCGRATLLLSP
jgi:hypothetical protein